VNKRLHPFVLAPVVLLALPGSAFAQSTQAPLNCDRSFGLRADVNGSAGKTVCSSNVEAFVDGVKNLNLTNNAYTDRSAAFVAGRFSDVNVLMRYDADSTTLHYDFREIDVRGSVTGATRDDSEEQLEEVLKKSNVLGKLLNYQARHSATSGITGVGGVIPMAAAQEFDSAFDSQARVAGAGGAEGANNLIGVGVSYSDHKIDNHGDRIKTTSLPLSYTIRNGIDPRRQLVISLPITVVSVGDARSLHTGLGLAYRLPVTDNWTITPGVKYSILGSKDRATVSSVVSGSLMSTYVIPTESVNFVIGNMVGYYQTGKFSSGDYSFDPDVQMKLTRNGVMASIPTTLFGKRMAAELSLIDTRYIGEKPYAPDQQEIGLTLGSNRNGGNARSFTRVGVNYFRSKGSNGVSANVGYWF
jgi:hypothetical protein